jgi:hypothetical protein
MPRKLSCILLPLLLSAHQSTISPTDSLTLERTLCYGSCPAYTVKIEANGTITWQGDRFVKTQGRALSHIDPSQAQSLIASALTNGFWSLRESYSKPVTDNPTSFTTLSAHGQTKRVSNYADAAPPALHNLEYQIDLFANTHLWRHGDPALELLDPRITGSDIYLAKPGVTELMQAAARQRNDEVSKLFAAKADPNAEDSSGWTALMYAAAEESPETISLLLTAHADPNHHSKMGQTALFAAVSHWQDDTTTLKLLTKAGADINAQDKQRNTPLMLAATHANVASITTLVDLHANTHLRNASGQTALDLLDAAKQNANTPEDYAHARALLTK